MIALRATSCANPLWIALRAVRMMRFGIGPLQRPKEYTCFGTTQLEINCCHVQLRLKREEDATPSIFLSQLKEICPPAVVSVDAVNTSVNLYRVIHESVHGSSDINRDSVNIWFVLAQSMS